MRWGFMASFAKNPKLTPINARAETVATSPFFRGAFRHQRCLIVADGFYEWRKEGRNKTPYFIHLRSGRPFGFAGIWSAKRNDAGTPSPSCAIVTCTANELMEPIHNRMPVILPAATRDRWLDPSAEADDLSTLLVPLPSDEMDAYAVSTVVNSPRNDSPACVRRVTG
jgi:putative SOS response-associated peptidase YedK